jgi:hypothetical protein
MSTDRQQLAKLYRRLASIPTSGDRGANRALIEMAQELESETAEQNELVAFTSETKPDRRRRTA